MPDHIIRLGRMEIPLTKARRNFRVVRPTRKALTGIRSLRALRGLHFDGAGIWRVAVADEESLDPAMDLVRRDVVAHHVYTIDDSEFAVPFIPNDRIYLRPRPGVDEASFRALYEQLHLERLRTRPDGTVVFRVTTATGMNPIKVCERLLSDPHVEVVEPDYFMNIQRTSDVDFRRQWHLHEVDDDNRVTRGSHINVEAAWEITRGSSDIVLALFDDGYDLTNPDLQGNIVDPADFSFVAELGDGEDELRPSDADPSSDAEFGDYHGTPCAGLAIGRRTSAVSGVAPECSWMPVRVGFGLVSQEDLLRVFEYISRRADVVSCSWAITPTRYQVPTEAQRSLFTTLSTSGGRRGRGLVVCFAAGNENLPTSIDAAENPNGYEYCEPSGARLGTFFRNKDIHSSWCELPGVITVGAVTARNRKALYSNWGRDVWVVAPSNNFSPAWPPEARRGSLSLVTTDNERSGKGLHEIGLSDRELGFVTDAMGGTSGATPQVAGLCALVLSANTSLSAADVRSIIGDTAARQGLAESLEEPVPANNQAQSGAFVLENGARSTWYGRGRIDAHAAVRAARR